MFEQYRLELNPITPVFIGSGKTYSKNEYIYLPEKHQILIPKIPKLFHEIMDRGLVSDYKDFIVSEQNGDLGAWLKACKFELDSEAEWVDYSMNLPIMEEDKFKKVEIQACMKNAYGDPYIPGSSLKGAIRTAMLASFIIHFKENFNKKKARVDSGLHNKFLLFDYIYMKKMDLF